MSNNQNTNNGLHESQKIIRDSFCFGWRWNEGISRLL